MEIMESTKSSILARLTDMREELRENSARFDKMSTGDDAYKRLSIYYHGLALSMTHAIEDIRSWKGIHQFDVKYGDGYFIFGTGTNSVVHFHLEETPGWLYGLWLSEIDHNDPKAQKPVKIKFFAQFEAEIDKFKPSASMVSEECIVRMGLYKTIECTHIKTAIHFIQKHPALAWYRDIHWVDYNDEYVPESAAKRRYELYLKARFEGLGDCARCGGLSAKDGCKGCLYDRAIKPYVRG